MKKFRAEQAWFIQQYERGPWHVETPGDPETMLCGIFISVDDNVKIQRRWGLKPCLFCVHKLEEMAAYDALPPDWPTRAPAVR